MTRPQAKKPMSTLEEITADTIDAKHVQQRIADWKKRIEDLYALVRSWLGPSFSFDVQSTVPMYEDLMKSAGIRSTDLPVLTIRKGGREVGRLEPRALWVIGVNGRLDLQCPAGPHLILDIAKSFANPDWRIAPLTARQRMTKLGGTKFAALFR